MNTLGIDIGNFGVKTSEGFYIPSKVTKTTSIFKENGVLLEYNSNKFIVGQGNYETETVKTTKENLYPLLLTAIAKSYEEEHIFLNLAIGLPLNQYAKKKKQFRNTLMTEYKDVFLSIDGQMKHISLNNVLIVPEGVGALYGINNPNFDKDNVVVTDIGGLTTNIFLVDNGCVKDDVTLDIGMLQLYDILYTHIKKDYVDLKLTYDKLEDILLKGVFVYYGESISAQKYIKELIPHIREIYNILKMKYPIESTQLVIVGGGSKHIHPLIQQKIKNAIFIDDVFANANGFKIIGQNVMK